MLTIKRVPTVVSNYQEDVLLESNVVGCGRKCLGKCCLPVSMLPLYSFKNDDNEPMEHNIHTLPEEEYQISFLNNLLLGLWEERMSQGLFRYDVTTCETKVIPGKCGFIAQLNEGRHLKKRPTEFRIDKVLQPFDENKFNFTKVGQDEVLFRFEPSTDYKRRYFSGMGVDAGISPSIVAINVSPIEYGHVLLIPRVLDCLPQRIGRDTFTIALHFAREMADPFFRVGYNSLGAFATINHLHYQAYYLSVPFPVEKAPVRKILARKGLGGAGVIVSKLLNYPVRGFTFEGENGSTIRDLSEVVVNSCISLQNKNIPFNILIAQCGKKIFLFPQCYAEKQALGVVDQGLLDTQVNPAVWEISGHMVLKRTKDYQDASEKLAWKLLSEVSLSEEKFEEVKGYISEAANLEEMEEDKSINPDKEIPDSPGPRVASHVPQDCLVLH
ncbi:GDP-L-galactose phosphorylase 1 [Capsicum baccatum]|uniref:GDP-D-glucose phosphorylase 1 n=1 Tax=Capsicum baccatum TaxID=33114 RepID=A0A2G2XH67_CAPBA|nr:GDP-L-galactose phosphorylase 1 [Capsicum baccatum]